VVCDSGIEGCRGKKRLLYGVDGRPEVLPDWISYKQQANETDIRRILNTCTVFLYTSNEEGYGLPGLEAMACGCVLLSTDCIGVREYGVAGENCLIFPIQDKTAMLCNCRKIFWDEALRKQLSDNGRKTAQSLDLTKQAKKFSEIIQGLI
jgi:glycosyltransferase involved in cell wall biosynthesis